MVKIYSFAFNEPYYIQLQVASFKRFIKQKHEFICINNAQDEAIRNEINNTCAEQGIKSEIVELPDHSLYGNSHQRALQWAWEKHISKHYGIAIIIDHDMFLINELNFMHGTDAIISGIPQSRDHVKYLHPGFIIFDVPKMPDKDMINFGGGQIDGHNVDSGGQLHHYISKHPEIKINYLPCVDIKEENNNLHLIPEEAREGYNERYNFQIISDRVFHLRIGSNWIHLSNEELEKRKTQAYKTVRHYLNK